MNEVRWNKDCPLCKKKMANHNKFCSLKCFEISQADKLKRSGIL